MSELIQKATQDVQQWNDISVASRGMLEPTKCSIQAMTWLFTMGGAPVLNPGDLAKNQVIVKSETNSVKSKSITGPSAYAAHKTLGIIKIRQATKTNKQGRYKRNATILPNSYSTVSYHELKPSKTYYQAIFSLGSVTPVISRRKS